MRRAEIEHLLPEVFQRTLHPRRPLPALLEVMERLHGPSEAALAALDATFDPRRTAPAFVPMLARWVGLQYLADLPRSSDVAAGASGPRLPFGLALGQLRELVAGAASLARRQGTGAGLRLFLEIATGVTGFIIDEEVLGPDGQPRPFHLVVRAPSTAASQRTLIERIVAVEKPAAVTFELTFGPDTKGGP
jgi:phage tail-like protein